MGRHSLLQWIFPTQRLNLCLLHCILLHPFFTVWARIKPTPPALEVQSLNHWTTREVPVKNLDWMNLQCFPKVPPQQCCVHIRAWTNVCFVIYEIARLVNTMVTILITRALYGVRSYRLCWEKGDPELFDLQRHNTWLIKIEKFFIQAATANTYYTHCSQGSAPVTWSRVMKDIWEVERKPADNWYPGQVR